MIENFRSGGMSDDFCPGGMSYDFRSGGMSYATRRKGGRLRVQGRGSHEAIFREDPTYLAVTNWAVSAVLLSSLLPREQRPVYFISKALTDAETRYSRMEQTVLALRTVAQKLRPYFQAYPITVLTNQPLRNVLHKPDITGRML